MEKKLETRDLYFKVAMILCDQLQIFKKLKKVECRINQKNEEKINLSI